MKQTIGIINDRLVAEMLMKLMLESMMIACRGRNTEPPRIAIIRPAPANFTLSPTWRRAMP
jgi:hypothetical protein